MGEGLGNEKDLMPYISSCSIACGGHAGNSQSMLQVALLAKRHQVKVGAHPSYPDKDNFGRVSMDILPELLIDSITNQMEDFVTILKAEKIELHHIKPHGALYNDIATNTVLARTFLKAIDRYRNTAYLYVPHASVISREAKGQSFKVKHEAFGDRNYNRDLSLISRSLSEAVIHSPEKALAHIVTMLKEGQVRTLDGDIIKIIAETFCIHGDTPSALQILMYLSEELPNHNIHIERA